MSMAATSLDAYHSFSNLELQKKERDVLDFFLGHPGLTVTRERLAEIMKWKDAAICGRANSLVSKGALEEIEGGKTSAGRSAKLLRLPVNAQQELFQ